MKKAVFETPAAPGIKARNPFSVEGDVVSMQLTQEQVTRFDLEDLQLVAAYRWYAVKVGSTFYAKAPLPRTNGNFRAILMHRLLCQTLPEKPFVDHSSHDGLDNRKINLRPCTKEENAGNSRPRTNGSSEFKGVSFHKQVKKFKAEIKVKGKKVHLGTFSCEVCAARAYDAAARFYWGDFACLNFPEELA